MIDGIIVRKNTRGVVLHEPYEKKETSAGLHSSNQRYRTCVIKSSISSGVVT